MNSGIYFGTVPQEPIEPEVHTMNRIKSIVRDLWNQSLFPTSGTTTRDESSWGPRQQRWLIASLVVTAAMLFLPQLSYPLVEPDETRYAQIAIEMNTSSDYITPTLDGEPYLDKPPLMYWLTAFCFRVFGEQEFAARLTPVVASLATVAIVYAFGQIIVGIRAAWFASMLLMLSAGFLVAGRFVILDSLLTFFVTASALAGFVAVNRSREDTPVALRWNWWMASSLLCALGVLTKGPIALVLVAPPLVVSGWLRRDHSRIGAKHWIAFAMPIIAITVPWYVAVWKSNPQFGDYFFFEHNLKRFTQGSNHRQPFWFYIPVVFAGMFPASLLVPSLATFVLARDAQLRGLRTREFGFLFLASVWVLGFFSISSCKLPTYILPAFPMLALMLGGMLDQTVFRVGEVDRIARFLKPFPQRAILIFIFAVTVLIGVDRFMGAQNSAIVAFAFIIATLVAVMAIREWNHEVAFGPRGWAAMSIVAVAMMGFVSTYFIPSVATARSLYSKTAAVAQEYPDSPILFFGEKPHASGLQLPASRVSYFDVASKDEFAKQVGLHQGVIVIADDGNAESTRQAIAMTHDLMPTGVHKRLFLSRRIVEPDADVATRPDITRR